AWLADPAQAGSNTLAVETQQVLDVPATTWQDAAPARGRVWFVIFQRAIDEAAARGERQANLKWLDKRYGLVSEERFGDLNVLLYQN
ncbi:MAG: hypothetical protein HY782_24015, partial [Chloroflexi bacterium]|nr:hypothetical protein [Chloroflexota bacterium]